MKRDDYVVDCYYLDGDLKVNGISWIFYEVDFFIDCFRMIS